MSRLSPPRADAALALLLAALATTLFIAWPDRPVDPNGAWYALAIARVSGLMLLAAAFGVQRRPRGAEARWTRLASLAFAWALTIPFEAVAYVATAPSASLVWSLAIALPATVAVYGLSAALATVARRARLGWALPLLTPLAALGVGAIDVRTEPVLILPWLLPFAPSWTGALVVSGAAVATVASAVAASRRAVSDAEPSA